MEKNRLIRPRLPDWLKRPLPPGGEGRQVRRLLKDLDLATVCQSARCPNQAECFARGTATFMILGHICTRSCRFCAVPSGKPEPVRADEPHAVAEAAATMGLSHVVVTSVTRDDLDDGGAEHFAETIRAIRRRLPHATVEVLTPDFLGRSAAIDAVLAARPDVFNHNVETVPRLYPTVRPEADYARSLQVLGHAAADPTQSAVKSGIMVGLGETRQEVLSVMHDLRDAGCNILTIGQYLSPTPEHLPVEEFIRPEQFSELETLGSAMDFDVVSAGPFVRSSYRAGEVLDIASPR